MDLAGRFNQVLQVSASQEVPQIDEFAVVLVLDVDNTPAVLSSANLLAVDDNVFLATDNGERNDVLRTKLLDTSKIKTLSPSAEVYLDLDIHSTFLVIQFVVFVGVHLEVVELELLLDSLLGRQTFLEGKGVGLGDDGNNVDDI